MHSAEVLSYRGGPFSWLLSHIILYKYTTSLRVDVFKTIECAQYVKIIKWFRLK